MQSDVQRWATAGLAQHRRKSLGLALMFHASWSQSGCLCQALVLLPGRKKWEARRAVVAESSLLIKKAKAFHGAATRRLALTYQGTDLGHMATPSSKRVWRSQCLSLLASVVEVGQIGNGH